MSSAIIILNYNDAENTKKLACSLRDYSCPEKIVLVDNCSTDKSFQTLLQIVDSRIDVIASPDNGGYAKGNNYGIRYVLEHYQPDFIFVANPDIYVEESVLFKIIAYMEKNPSCGVMSCIVRQGYNVWNLPGFCGILESLFLIWFNLHKRHLKRKLLSSTNAAEPVGVVEGSFFCIRSSTFTEIGGLDERTFLYAEEIILSRRLKNLGYYTAVLTKEFYDHYHSVSIKKAYHSKAKAFHNFYKSFRLYNTEYLHTNALQNGIFRLAYGLAYIERLIYDFIIKIRL